MKKKGLYTLDELERYAMGVDLVMEFLEENEPIFFKKNGKEFLDMHAMTHEMLCRKRDPRYKHLWAN